MSHDDTHGHDDAHGHSHAPPEEIVVRVKALENLMIRKGLVDPAAVDEMIEHYENRIGPHVGAKVVARAWTDPEYKARLLTDANGALAELDVSRLQGEDVVVVENTDSTHNVLVCTLCSCYPWNLLGLPPVWYKSTAFRSRIVKEPRVVLKDDFGLPIAEDVEVRVWDANAELRYMVLPRRPAGTDGMSAADLERLVTRDSMLGTGQPLLPGA